MTLKIKAQCIRPIDRRAPVLGKKINNTPPNKNVKLPTLTLSYYVIIPFMKTIREKTIASKHVLSGAIKLRPSKNINY